jgi:hypothetical protein
VEKIMSKLNAVARLSLLAFMLSLAACSSGPTRVESNLGLSGAPDWVNQGTSVLNNNNGRLFHGVGSASPMGDMALQKSVADDRARAEAARILTSCLDVVSDDYMDAAKSGDTSVTEERYCAGSGVSPRPTWPAPASSAAGATSRPVSFTRLPNWI